MSMMISGDTASGDPAPVLKSKIHKMSLLPKAFISSNSRPSQLSQQRQSMLKDMCSRITAEQRANIKQMANDQAKQQIRYLKSKMRRNANNHNIEKMMEPKRQDKQNYLRHVFSLDAETTDLTSKYNKKIHQRMGVVRQLQSVENDKQHYRQWHSQTKNNVMMSPNYTKVNYLLERMGTTQGGAVILGQSKKVVGKQVIREQERGAYRVRKRVFNSYMSLHNLKQT